MAVTSGVLWRLKGARTRPIAAAAAPACYSNLTQGGLPTDKEKNHTGRDSLFTTGGTARATGGTSRRITNGRWRVGRNCLQARRTSCAASMRSALSDSSTCRPMGPEQALDFVDWLANRKLLMNDEAERAEERS